MKRLIVAILAVLTAGLVVATPAASDEVLSVPDDVIDAVSSGKTDDYVVVMSGQPMASTVGRADLRSGSALATDTESALVDTHEQALDAVGVPDGQRLYDFTAAIDGFAARLTDAQVDALQARADVVAVFPEQILHVDTSDSPDYVGATAPNGPYANGITGEDVVVGVIDTGIWPEHPSFADDGSYDDPPASFTGEGCEFGNSGFNPDDDDFECNDKLLAAKAYGQAFHGGTGEGLADGEYLSARDADGHGSHTAGTAAGNSGVQAEVFGNDFGMIQGIAPRARLSVYKGCWATSPIDGGCSNVDLVAAIDAAVADGVDVINYSIGSATATLGPDDISFLFANAAGVHVATSAGNSGPFEMTVGSPASTPWITTVAASTQNKTYINHVGLLMPGEPADFYGGVSITNGTDGFQRLVDAEDHGNTLCLPDVEFDPPITDRIVLCERGAIARVAKSLAVEQQGGVGMILWNPTVNSLNTDLHYVPTIHVDAETGQIIKDYIDDAGNRARATISAGEREGREAPQIAAFSSRGPNALYPDIIKPDITAPGVNIMAANTPTHLLGAGDDLFQAISGTSMSSPHVAGAYALLAQAHPEWSASAAKSALMGSARNRGEDKEDGVRPADPFDHGAGYLTIDGNDDRRMGSFLDPGIVYEAGLGDYFGFLCDVDPTVFVDPDTLCAELESFGIPTTATDLNYPSIGASEVVGRITIERTITNVSDRPAIFSGRLETPPGFRADIEGRVARIVPGASHTFRITFTRTSAAIGSWSFGELVWESNKGHKTWTPIALRAVELSAPGEVVHTGTSGSDSLEVGFGYDGDYEADAHGLVAPDTIDGNVVDDPANDINTALATGVGVTFHDVTVPEGTAYARFSLFDEETDGTDDLDLYVFDGDGNFVGGSGSGTSEEEVNVVLPEPGTYTVAVHGWQTDGPDANYTLYSWMVPLQDNDRTLRVTSAPDQAELGTTGTVEYRWRRLDDDTRYLGAISHTGDGQLLALTVVEVNTGDTGGPGGGG